MLERKVIILQSFTKKFTRRNFPTTLRILESVEFFADRGNKYFWQSNKIIQEKMFPFTVLNHKTLIHINAHRSSKLIFVKLRKYLSNLGFWLGNNNNNKINR